MSESKYFPIAMTKLHKFNSEAEDVFLLAAERIHWRGDPARGLSWRPELGIGDYYACHAIARATYALGWGRRKARRLCGLLWRIYAPGIIPSEGGSIWSWRVYAGEDVEARILALLLLREMIRYDRRHRINVRRRRAAVGASSATTQRRSLSR